jgi:hypothetical protein
MVVTFTNDNHLMLKNEAIYTTLRLCALFVFRFIKGNFFKKYIFAC